MKRLLGILLVGIVGVTAQAAVTDKFIENLMSCTPYVQSDTTEMFGMTVESRMEILGRSGEFCGFKSSLNTPSGGADISCKFTAVQIAELVSAMAGNSQEIESFAKQGLDSNPAIGDNPAVATFNKYINDPTVCSVTN